MKKLFKYLFIAASVALLASCSRELSPETVTTTLEDNQFVASLSSSSTKMSIDGSTYNVSWNKGDSVSVFDGSGIIGFGALNDGQTTVLQAAEYTIDPAKTYYAAYPLSNVLFMDSNCAVINIPSIQTPVCGSFPENYAVAKTDGTQKSFSFSNVCGLIEFDLTASDVTDIIICGNNGEYLAGNAVVDYKTLETMVEDDAQYGVVTLHSDTPLSAGQYFVTVLPQTFSKGISIAMNKADGTQAAKATSKAFTLNRSHRIDFKTIDSESFAKVTLINTAADFAAFLIGADKYAAEDVVTLNADIDLGSSQLVSAKSFAGTLNGNGKTIKNFYGNCALIDTLKGTVKNLTFDAASNLSVPADGDVAFIAKHNAGLIDNCTNNGFIDTPSGQTYTAARHLGVFAATSSGQITNCTNNGDVLIVDDHANTAASQWIGGIAGYVTSADAATPAISGCTNNGKVYYLPTSASSKTYLGGICGGTSFDAAEAALLKDCSNTGEVKFAKNIESDTDDIVNMGGIVGYSAGSLDNCDNSGKVTFKCFATVTAYPISRPAVGGVAGTVLHSLTGCDNSGEIKVTGCCWIGPAVGTEGVGQDRYPAFGGVVAQAGCKDATSYSLSNCTNTGDITVSTTNLSTKASGIIRFGGVVGYALVPVTNCSNNASLAVCMKDTRMEVGGIAGNSLYAITSCTNSGTLNFDFGITEAEGELGKYVHAGGIVGSNFDGDADNLTDVINNAKIIIDNGYNSGGRNMIGGIAGTTNSRIQGSNKTTPAENKGDITINGNIYAIVGGMSGNHTHTCQNVKNSGNISFENAVAQSCVGGLDGVKAATTALQNAEVCGNITVKHTGDISDNVRVGMLYGAITKSGTELKAVAISGGTLTVENCYAGTVCGQLSGSNKLYVGVAGSSAQYFKIKAGVTSNGHTYTKGEDLTSDTAKGYLVGTVKKLTQITVAENASVVE